MNRWAEYTDIVYEDLSNEGQIAVQQVHESTKKRSISYEIEIWLWGYSVQSHE